MIAVEQRLKRLRNCPPYRFPHSTEEMLSWLGGKGFANLKQWDAQQFALHGKELILTISRTARLIQRKAIPHLAQSVRTMLNHQVEAVIQRATGGKNVSLWMEAIEEVFKRNHLESLLEIGPPVQSVMHQGYSKVSAALAQKPNPDVSPKIIQQTREIAERITRINETTKRQIQQHVEKMIDKGSTVTETAQGLREKMPELNTHRALTIARTELNNAWTQGSAAAYLESKTISHVSVIGCEAEEENSPHYHGRSTCNYPMLPIHELPQFLEVGFHVNHSGTIVPAGFRPL